MEGTASRRERLWSDGALAVSQPSAAHSARLPLPPGPLAESSSRLGSLRRSSTLTQNGRIPEFWRNWSATAGWSIHDDSRTARPEPCRGTQALVVATPPPLLPAASTGIRTKNLAKGNRLAGQAACT